jgi:predicted nucleotidyltransferase
LLRAYNPGKGYIVMLADERTRNIILLLVDKIRQGYQPKKIILYGSYAYGEPDEQSDIDLLIIKETKERAIDRRVRVRRIVDIRDATYPAFCPLVVTPDELQRRLEMGDQFFEKILSQGEVLYEH